MKNKESQETNIPEILIQANIGKATSKCKNCGHDMSKYLPEKYREKINSKNDISKSPVIHKNLVSDVVCDKCGCNLVDVTISIEIENPLKTKETNENDLGEELIIHTSGKKLTPIW